MAPVKRLPTRAQAHALRQTRAVANTACNSISHQAWENTTFRQLPLHPRTYRNTRATFQLSAQVVVRCVSKVAEAYKIDRQTKRTFKPHGALAFDHRSLAYKLERKEISIWTVEGRQRMAFTAGKRHLELLSSQRGESDLCFVKGKFYLFVAWDVETPKAIEVEGVLGVDLGMVNLASDSDGENFSGAKIARNRRIFEPRRTNLQKKQTKSAQRKLKNLSGKQASFQKPTTHTIRKQLVQKAQDTGSAMALEDWSGIRQVQVRRSQRSQHSHGSVYQLRQFIHYQAERAGVSVLLVDPHNTSRTGPACGCVDQANRLAQSLVSCVSCGFSAPADTVAAVNISARAVVNQPRVSADGLGTMPRPRAAGSFTLA